MQSAYGCGHGEDGDRAKWKFAKSKLLLRYSPCKRTAKEHSLKAKTVPKLIIMFHVRHLIYDLKSTLLFLIESRSGSD